MKKYSLNPLTNIKIEIPKILDDVDNIENFINNNSDKELIVVQGLGFVGAVIIGPRL